MMDVALLGWSLATFLVLFWCQIKRRIRGKGPTQTAVSRDPSVRPVYACSLGDHYYHLLSIASQLRIVDIVLAAMIHYNAPYLHNNKLLIVHDKHSSTEQKILTAIIFTICAVLCSKSAYNEFDWTGSLKPWKVRMIVRCSVINCSYKDDNRIHTPTLLTRSLTHFMCKNTRRV